MSPSIRQTRRRVGKTDLFVSLLGFGAAPIGNLYRPVASAEALSAVKAALELGIGYFDTAPYYGFGLSEQRLGDALTGVGDMVVSSKVGRLLKQAPDADPHAVRHGFAEAPALEPVYDYSYDAVMRSYEASKRRLGRKRIDILLAHDLGEVKHGNNHDQRFREFMDGGYHAMLELRDSGEVTAIGVGANEWQVCLRALEGGDFDCFLLAGRYSLLDQSAAEHFFPRCAQHGASVLLGGAFNSGILATGVTSGSTPYYDYEPAPAAIIERVRRLQSVCDEFNVPLPAAALQFPAAHPQVSSVVAGVACVQECRAASAYMSFPIPADFWEVLKAWWLLDPAVPVPGEGAV